MNREAHLIIGVFTSIFLAFGIDTVIYHVIASLPFAFLGSAIGSAAPDVLEPAKHWTHRKFWHSKRMLRNSVYGMLILILPSFLLPILWLGFYFFFGYFLHLLADSLTKMGLPE